MITRREKIARLMARLMPGSVISRNLAACGAAVALAALALGFWPSPAAMPTPEVLQIRAATFDYRPFGAFRIGTRMVGAPLNQGLLGAGFAIAVYQVSRGDYLRCVRDMACKTAASPQDGADLMPQTGVSYQDAIAYAAWLTTRTRQVWRLPSDAEWRRAAAERAVDISPGTPAADPAQRWLAAYRAEAKAAAPDPVLRQLGSFGTNSAGIADLAGNVWEWTSTCAVNAMLAADGQLVQSTDYCGVRLVEGRHRTFVPDFIRDASAGGCAAGLPPDHLGFRLVRD